MDLTKLEAEFQAHLHDPSLWVTTNLQGRDGALDFTDWIEKIAQVRGRDPDFAALHQRALIFKAQLEAINTALFQQFRRAVQQGEWSRQTLREQLNQFTPYLPGPHLQAHIGYDGLDTLVAGLFEFEPPPQATLQLDDEMVHYEPTPARAILDLIDHVGFTAEDIFYDLGAGLGQVAMLVHLLTGVQVKAVEIETVFCTYAQQCAQALGIQGVDFINGDARHVDYADGTIFYLFTPFGGALLQTVLDKLADQARTRPIKVCTYGPCTAHIARQPWLHSLDDSADHEFKVAIFESRG